jgi:hypothetical protein
LNEQQCAHNLQTTRCNEKIWDETLMEDGTMPSIVGNRKQQFYGVVEDDVKLMFVCCAIFSHIVYYLQVMANFCFYFW